MSSPDEPDDWPEFTTPVRHIGSDCSVDGCNGEPYALGLCSKHYNRQYRARKRSDSDNN